METEPEKHRIMMEEKVLEVLKKSTKPLPPQEIAHQVGFSRPFNQAALVNPILFTLLEREEIVRITNKNGTKPHYIISAPASTELATSVNTSK